MMDDLPARLFFLRPSYSRARAYHTLSGLLNGIRHRHDSWRVFVLEPGRDYVEITQDIKDRINA